MHRKTTGREETKIPTVVVLTGRTGDASSDTSACTSTLFSMNLWCLRVIIQCRVILTSSSLRFSSSDSGNANLKCAHNLPNPEDGFAVRLSDGWRSKS